MIRPPKEPSRPRYRSLSNFYTAEPLRIHSREFDIGLWWRDDASGPLHRAAWVQETGELYLVRLGTPEQGGGEVEVLAVVEDREQLENVLEGWREECGGLGSLTWLREHATRFSERMHVVHLRVATAVGAASAMLAGLAVMAMEL
jgi:hypothetical protein